jgi:hypothetical protein
MDTLPEGEYTATISAGSGTLTYIDDERASFS